MKIESYHYGWGVSVRIKKMTFWMDCCIDDLGDFHAEWNEYIFCENNSIDMERKKIQDNLRWFRYAKDIAYRSLIRKGYLIDNGEAYIKAK